MILTPKRVIPSLMKSQSGLTWEVCARGGNGWSRDCDNRIAIRPQKDGPEESVGVLT